MTDAELEARAQAAYEAYAFHAGGRAFDGHSLGVWADLPERIRDNWREAVIAAMRWTPPRDRQATPAPTTAIEGHVTRTDSE